MIVDVMSDLVTFPYVPVKIYDLYKKQNRYKFEGFDSIGKSLKKLFEDSQRGERLAQLILFDFYISINHPTIYKENITGKRIEQKLSKLFALSTEDEIPKGNPNINTLLSNEEIEQLEKSILELICSNNRQKGDLYFFQSTTQGLYKLSIKSLTPDNKEINFGAFEFQSTIKGIIGLEQLLNVQERKRTVDLSTNGNLISNIGIGSSAQMKKLHQYIYETGKLEEYLSRFKILLKGVYKDDFLIYIKDNSRFKIFLLKNEDFIEIVIEKVKNGFVNIRYEGNSIRITDLNLFENKSKYKVDVEVTKILPSFEEIQNKFTDLEYEKIKLFSL